MYVATDLDGLQRLRLQEQGNYFPLEARWLHESTLGELLDKAGPDAFVHFDFRLYDRGDASKALVILRPVR